MDIFQVPTVEDEGLVNKSDAIMYTVSVGPTGEDRRFDKLHELVYLHKHLYSDLKVSTAELLAALIMHRC